MFKSNVFSTVGLLITIGINITACSDVRFSPTPEVSDLECNGADCTPPPITCASGQFCEDVFEKVTDNFTMEGKTPKVDILFVVDNSPSMYEEQLKLGDRIRNFISNINTLDWQIGITTTDVSNGRFGLKGGLVDLGGGQGKILRKNMANFEKTFLEAVVRPESLCDVFECPSSDEQPLRASIYALEKSVSENKDFFRNDADLVIVYMSDEDEMSIGGDSATKAQEVLQAVDSYLGPDKVFTAYGIVVEPGDRDCLDAGKVSPHYYGKHVTELVGLTSGFTGSLCDQDYASTLHRIGQRVRQITDRVELTKSPYLNEVIVELIPEQKQIKYTVSGRFVLFSHPPQEGTQVKVDYQIKRKRRVNEGIPQ